MPASARSSAARSHDVGREGHLARARLGDAHRLDRTVVEEMRTRAQLTAPCARRSAARAARRRRPASSPTVRMPSAASRSAVFGPMPWRTRVGWPAKCATACSRLIATNAAGLKCALAVLATRRDGPIPTDSVIAGALAARPPRARAAARRGRARRSGRGRPHRFRRSGSRRPRVADEPPDLAAGARGRPRSRGR